MKLEAAANLPSRLGTLLSSGTGMVSNSVLISVSIHLRWAVRARVGGVRGAVCARVRARLGRVRVRGLCLCL